MKTYSSIPGRERFRSVSCNLCGGRSHRRTLVCRDYTFVKCNLCGLVYQNPQPVFSDLKHRYRQNYFEYELQNETNFFHLMKLGLEDIRFSELTADLNGRKKFLDVGYIVGDGRLLSRISRRPRIRYGSLVSSGRLRNHTQHRRQYE